MLTPDAAFEVAKYLVGGRKELAKRLGLSENGLNRWRENGQVSAEYALPVSEATGYQVTPHQLRPDLYPNATDALPITHTSRRDEPWHTTTPQIGATSRSKSA